MVDWKRGESASQLACNLETRTRRLPSHHLDCDSRKKDAPRITVHIPFLSSTTSPFLWEHSPMGSSGLDRTRRLLFFVFVGLVACCV